MLILADLKPGEVLYDLGSGDGRAVIMAAKDFGAKSVGVELKGETPDHPERHIYCQPVFC